MSSDPSSGLWPSCSRWLDSALSRLVVEPRFVPRHPSDRAQALRERLPLLRDLSEKDWFDAPPQLDPLRVTEGRYRDASTKTIEWQQPTIEAGRRLGVSPRTNGPRACLYGPGQRRVWILLHGWLGGNAAIDRLLWPFDALLETSDLMLVTLLGHAGRRVSTRGIWPSFPTRNPIANAIGLALATTELRQLIAWLRCQGYERIGVAGTSIGGYVAALLATVQGDLDRLLLDRVLVRMSEPLRRAAARRGAPNAELLATLERIYAPVSPLSRCCRVPSERIAILVGRGDHIVGTESAQLLAEHLGVTPQWFDGGHVLPIGRGRQLARIFDQL